MSNENSEFEANAFKNITSRIINTALNAGKPNTFTFAENLQENSSDFTFCQPEKASAPGKSIRILEMLPSKIQEKFGDLKQHALARAVYRFGFRIPAQDCIQKWKFLCTKMGDEEKIKNAASTVDKMSKVSRSFIALNAIGSLMKKKEAVLLCKGMQGWRKRKSTLPSSTAVPALKLLTAVKSISSRSFFYFCNEAWRHSEFKRQKELTDLKLIVKQYGHWEQRINEIEDKLKSENEELLNKARYLEAENYKLQETLIDKNKDLVEKIAVIESLSVKLKEKVQKAQLELSLIHICRCRRYAVCRSRWSPYH
eukprot:TRINITY_DN3491_c0_g1_i2.p1 TRINITY_DN3491_c0_g1~~TRINITY_DN3491_c0_g1_i2.p1  ORF type:complete len:311 (+),score=72.76 TRINITY_DN3491_c0_g1_i2:136-1068(+)